MDVRRRGSEGRRRRGLSVQGALTHLLERTDGSDDCPRRSGGVAVTSFFVRRADGDSTLMDRPRRARVAIALGRQRRGWLRRRPDVEVAVVCDIDETRAADHRRARGRDGLRRAGRRRSPRTSSTRSSSARHRRCTSGRRSRASSVDLAVYLEKPLARSLEDGRQISRLPGATSQRRLRCRSATHVAQPSDLLAHLACVAAIVRLSSPRHCS